MIETVTRQVLDRPEQRDAAGRVTVPAAYRTETRQEIVRPRGPFRFRVPCPAEMDAAFVAALQRALAARGHYAGPVTGEMDPATRRAVRRFQAPFGYDTATLSLEAARRMGLAVYAPPPPRILPQ